MPVQKKKRGAPSKFTQAIADEVCRRLILPESLRSICRDENMPEMKTVFNWLNTNKDFLQQYTRARELQADVIAEETFEIADDGRNDFLLKDGNVVVDHENIQRSRLRLDQRKWWLSKLAPKKYGDKVELEHTGETLVRVKIGGNAS